MAELKWARKPEELGWTLWDLYKMVAATYWPDTEACFVIVGAPSSRWAAGKRCASLFSTNVWESRELFKIYEKEWKNLLAGGSARPVAVPSHITTSLVADIRIPADSVEWRLRCIEVGPASMGRLEFDGNWPLGHFATEPVRE